MAHRGIINRLFSTLVCTATLVVWASPAPGQCDRPELDKLVAMDAASGDVFGWSVSISGNTAIVGARMDDHAGGLEAGSAYVFVRVSGVWVQQAKLVAADAASGDWFGFSVAISGDTAVVGAQQDDHGAVNGAGSAYVFVRSSQIWTQQAKLIAFDAGENDLFGLAVAISGDTAIVGASRDNHPGGVDAGSAYVFVRSGSVWSEQTKIVAEDAAAGGLFGNVVALDEETAVIGSVSVGGLNGSAYVFVRSGETWSQQAKLVPSDASDGFVGYSVAVSGDTAVVGADLHAHAGGIYFGSAYVFVRAGNVWTEQAELLAGGPDSFFGNSTAVSGDLVVVGAFQDDTVAGENAGSAYVFERDGSVWTQQARVTASDAAGMALFGRSVGVSGDTLVIGADPANSAYVFDLPAIVRAGDVNGDLVVDGDDIAVFVDVLLDMDADPAHVMRADVDCSTAVNLLDVSMLVAILLN